MNDRVKGRGDGNLIQESNEQVAISWLKNKGYRVWRSIAEPDKYGVGHYKWFTCQYMFPSENVAFAFKEGMGTE